MSRFGPALAACLLAAGALGACASNKDEPATLQGYIDEIFGDMDQLLGGSSVPGEYLRQIRGVHQPGNWKFRPDADEPLEVTREAVRGLGTADYAEWAEAALVTQVLSTMADEHPSALVRAEALDTLTKMATWTLDTPEPGSTWATEDEVIRAVKQLNDVREGVAMQPGEDVSLLVASAIGTIAAYDFERRSGEPRGDSARSLSREYGNRLRTARGILIVLNGPTLEPYRAHPEVRDALDLAYVGVCSSVIRMSLYTSCLKDSSETARTAAVRDISGLALPGGPAVLGIVLSEDETSSVRRTAAGALSVYGTAEAVPPLLIALADDRTQVRTAAARSLEAVTGESFGTDRAAWVRWWNAHGDTASEAAPVEDEPAPGR